MARLLSKTSGHMEHPLFFWVEASNFRRCVSYNEERIKWLIAQDLREEMPWNFLTTACFIKDLV